MSGEELEGTTNKLANPQALKLQCFAILRRLFISHKTSNNLSIFNYYLHYAVIMCDDKAAVLTRV